MIIDNDNPKRSSRVSRRLPAPSRVEQLKCLRTSSYGMRKGEQLKTGPSHILMSLAHYEQSTISPSNLYYKLFTRGLFKRPLLSRLIWDYSRDYFRLEIKIYILEPHSKPIRDNWSAYYRLGGPFKLGIVEAISGSNFKPDRILNWANTKRILSRY